MKTIAFLAFIACVSIAGCAPANITASKWDSGLGSVSTKIRCEQVDMRNKSEMDQIFAKYDGWKLIYISEYTTGHKIGTDSAVCFESPK